MISKKQSFAVLVIAAFIGCSFAQPGKPAASMDRTICDGFGRIITEKTDSAGTTYYYTLTGDTIEMGYRPTVEFIGGKDSLRSYLDSHYYGYVGSNSEELNLVAYFVVLLDADMNIMETRIMNRTNTALKPPLDSLFVGALNASSGHWQKVNPNDSLPRYHMTAVSYRIF